MGDIMQMYSSGIYDQIKSKLYVATSSNADIAINADPGAIAATEAMMTVYNSATAASLPNTVIIPRFLRLTCTVVGASGTTFDMRFSADSKNRYTSGGTTLTGKQTQISTTAATKTSKATINFGDIVMPAASAETALDYVEVHSATAAQIAGDQYLFTWGNFDMPSALMSASARQSYHFQLAEVFLKRGTTMYIQPLSASAASTAAEFYVTFGYIEAQRGD